MKYVLMMTLLAFTLTGCGEDKEEKKEDKPIELKTEKDKWSYFMGYQSTSNVTNAQNPNRSQFLQNKEHIIEGFKEGYRDLSQEELNTIMQNVKEMMGGTGNGSTFNADAAEKGCKAMGKSIAYQSYKNFEPYGATKLINLDKFTAGFIDGIHEKPNRVSDEEFKSFQNSFNEEVARLQQEAMSLKEEQGIAAEAKYAPRWEKIKEIDGIKELENGIYLETIKEGSGPKPAIGDDIEASYVLRQFDGTVKQDSKDVTPDGKFQANLAPGSLIDGWIIGFQAMKVGGKYRLYVPAASAYKDEPLEFEIEFFQKGPAGSLAQPRGPRR
ncbi:MAG: FKBP-type peptidyl-prolyl cis-trans isomerase [Fluviicola sp.]